jgi:N-acetylglucosaminyldiphosphoundecaprenol N-acetyl-beta-D-mannosaminyltransferase
MKVRESVALRNIRFNALTETEAVTEIIERWRNHEGGWVSTPNTHQLEILCRSPELRKLVGTASLVLPDGMPLVWASLLRGTPLPERVAGSNLVWSLARAAAEAGASLFLLGGEDGVAQRAQTVLERELPAVRVVGTHAPPFGFESDPAEVTAIKQLLSASEPDIIYVGLGFPKQELLIQELVTSFPKTWFLGIGMSLGFISGDAARAPEWFQRLGLEWVHRLSREPRRLFKRYVVHGVPFTAGLLIESCFERVHKARS